MHAIAPQLAGWLAVLLAATASVSAAPEEAELKAAFLYRFAGFVAWPEDAFASADEPLALCVLGDDAVASSLEAAVAGKSVQGRPAALRRPAGADAMAACHVLFVGEAEAPRTGAVLRGVAGHSVLTVGDAEGFVERGGMIELRREGAQMRFEIDRSAAESAGLHISSQLLRLAANVRGGR